jgi:hypothetical protein
LLVLIPIVYFNFFITIGYGLAVGVLGSLMVKVTYNRNRKSRLVYIIVMSFLANYFQWTVYILYAYLGKMPDPMEYINNLYWIIQPINIIDLGIEINKFGLWTLGSIPFKGFGLTFIWIIESLIIFLLSFLVIYRKEAYPYSEQLNKWYPKYTLSKDFKFIANKAVIKKALQADALETLQNIGNGMGTRHTKIHLFYLENTREQYLTIENISYEQGGRGKKHSEILLNNLRLDKAKGKSIFNSFDTKREWFETF